jgi:hypothetical protein
MFAARWLAISVLAAGLTAPAPQIQPPTPVGAAGTVTGVKLSPTTAHHDASVADAYRRGATTWQPVRVVCIDRLLQVFSAASWSPRRTSRRSSPAA